jgi:hypothetical protein
MHDAGYEGAHRSGEDDGATDLVRAQPGRISR